VSGFLSCQAVIPVTSKSDKSHSEGKNETNDSPAAIRHQLLAFWLLARNNRKMRGAVENQQPAEVHPLGGTG
jgi:hypothetical protein